ncbi:MAG TPA: hypothetical protein VE843_00720, partial [Ktedonobacteraceae bacterium]|nr:hypothetical protein [Ktedonobacteraceae bacterium]
MPMLLLGISLPLASVVVHRFVTNTRNIPQEQNLTGRTFVQMWEWPLLITGLIFGMLSSFANYLNGMSAMHSTFDAQIPIAVEIAPLAVTWYVSSALAHMKLWLIPSVGFAIGALLIPTDSFWVLLILTPLLALSGVAISYFFARSWSIPFYLIAVFSAVQTGYTGFTQNQILAASWALLGFAALAYVIGVIEKNQVGMWIMPVFALWSVIYSTGFLGDQYRLPIVALVCAALGVSVKYFRLEPMPFFGTIPRNKFLTYALPFYATATIAAVLTGACGTVGNINSPFYGAIPDALLIYALVAFAVLVFERQPVWLWLTAGLAIWGTLLTLELTAYYLFGIGLAMALLGLTTGFVSRRMVKTSTTSKYLKSLQQFTWSWPWYMTASIAALSMGMWTSLFLKQPVTGFIGYSMLAFTILAIVIMLVERAPELLVFPTGLAAATIWLWEEPPLDLVPLMIAFSLLFLVVFASQFTWKFIPPASRWVSPAVPHAILALAGQTIVVLSIISQGGLTSNGPAILTHVGAGSLLELALLLFWYGYLHIGIVDSAND